MVGPLSSSPNVWKLGSISKLVWFAFLHSVFRAVTKKSVQGFDFPNFLHILLLPRHLATLPWSYIPLDLWTLTVQLLSSRLTLATLIWTVEKSGVYSWGS